MIIMLLRTLLLIAVLWTVVPFEIQSQKVKNILVIPFDRFEMHSDILLDDINSINNFVSDQFYVTIVKYISVAFETNSNEKVNYKIITEADLAKIRPSLYYNFIKNSAHYSCLIDSVNKSTLKEILNENLCDYLLTINWYRIKQKKISVKVDSKKKVAFYSSHYIDYDLFTSFGTLIREGSQLEIQVQVNAENYKKMGLFTDDLRPLYPQLINDITGNIINVD